MENKPSAVKKQVLMLQIISGPMVLKERCMQMMCHKSENMHSRINAVMLASCFMLKLVMGETSGFL
jgi:hypothetical protein